MNTESLHSIIKSSPNNPEKIFQLLNLPITYIDDVQLLKNENSRVFKYMGKNLFSPEIVAVVHYENQGHIASWNEGLAFYMVKNAFERVLTRNLFDQLEYVGIKKEALLISNPLYDTVANRAITRAEQLLTLDNDYLERHKPQLEDIERRHQSEKIMLENKTDFPIAIEHLLKNQVEWIRFLFDGKVSIQCKSKPEELIALFLQNIDNIRSNKSYLINELCLPDKTGDKTDPHQKFVNKWTMKFANEIVENCDFDYLLHELFRFSSISPRWDLTLIDGFSKKLRYIEVKMDDKFTQSQLSELPSHLKEGGTLELCKIRPRKVG